MRVDQVKITVGSLNLEVDDIKLHPVEDVQAWQEKLGEAQEQLGGFSTGIGVLSSPGVAIASAAAIGILEAAVTSSKEKKGLRLLAEASRMLAQLRAGGEFVAVSEIEGVASPLPSDWCVMRTGKVVTDLSSYGIFERNKVIEKHNVTVGETFAGKFEREGLVRSLVVLPDEFVWTRTAQGDIAVRWTSVASYSVKATKVKVRTVTE
jgi:hypothetical protein